MRLLFQGKLCNKIRFLVRVCGPQRSCLWAAAGTLPRADPNPILMTPQEACGGAQSAAVMRSMASCVSPGRLLHAISELTSNADEPPFSAEQQRDVVLKAHVASVHSNISEVRCDCFMRML
jgi:hypothetical protein